MINIIAAALIISPSIGPAKPLTYTVTDARVTYAGGTWPSDGVSGGLTGAWTYTTGGQGYHDGTWWNAKYEAINHMDSITTFTNWQLEKALMRSNITIEFKVEASGSTAPPTVGAKFSRKYRLYAGASHVSPNAVDCFAETCGDTVAINDWNDPNPQDTGYVVISDISSLGSSGWVNDSPGHYYKWFAVPYTGVDNENIETLANGDETVSCEARGEWHYRIESLNGGAIFLQNGY